MQVKVSNLYFISQDYLKFQPTHVVSILDPCIREEYIPRFAAETQKLQLFFYDADKLHFQSEPIVNFVSSLLEFLAEFIASDDSNKRLLLHCHAGVSRSTAAAYLLFCLANPDAKKAFTKLLEITNKPWPNRHMIELADSILKRNGELLFPVEEYYQANVKRFAAYQRLYKNRDLDRFVFTEKMIPVDKNG